MSPSQEPRCRIQMGLFIDFGRGRTCAGVSVSSGTCVVMRVELRYWTGQTGLERIKSFMATEKDQFKRANDNKELKLQGANAKTHSKRARPGLRRRLLQFDALNSY